MLGNKGRRERRVIRTSPREGLPHGGQTSERLRRGIPRVALLRREDVAA